jgi:hypothetical protein
MLSIARQQKTATYQSVTGYLSIVLLIAARAPAAVLPARCKQSPIDLPVPANCDARRPFPNCAVNFPAVRQTVWQGQNGNVQIVR